MYSLNTAAFRREAETCVCNLSSAKGGIGSGRRNFGSYQRVGWDQTHYRQSIMASGTNTKEGNSPDNERTTT